MEANPLRSNLTIWRNATFETALQITNPGGINGWQGVLTIFPRGQEATVVLTANLTIVDDGQVDNVGKLLLALTPTQTATLVADTRYGYTVVATDLFNKVYPLQYGKVFVGELRHD